jgi:hypothetical protein
MRLELISAEVSRGKGWARVSFKEKNTDNIIESVAIIRPRHTEPFLGKNGWQISECRIPLLIEIGPESHFSFLLQPAVVQYLEVSSNYEFIFFDCNTNRISTVIVRWSGISYRPPKGAVSPIEVIETQPRSYEPAEPKPTNIVGSWGTKEFPITSTPHESTAQVINPPSSDVFVSGGNDFQDTTPNEIFVQPVVTPEKPREVRKIKCKNFKCEADILDSMKICPFCKFPR